MKKTTLLNSEISRIVAECGHKDLLVIADSGLPVTENTKRIDIALSPGVPSFFRNAKGCAFGTWR